MKLNLGTVPPSFRKLYIEEELVQHIQAIIDDMDAGQVFTGDDIFAKAQRSLDKSKSVLI